MTWISWEGQEDTSWRQALGGRVSMTNPRWAKYFSVVIVSASYQEQEPGIFTACCDQCESTEEDQARTQGKFLKHFLSLIIVLPTRCSVTWVYNQGKGGRGRTHQADSRQERWCPLGTGPCTTGSGCRRPGAAAPTATFSATCPWCGAAVVSGLTTRERRNCGAWRLPW